MSCRRFVSCLSIVLALALMPQHAFGLVGTANVVIVEFEGAPVLSGLTTDDPSGTWEKAAWVRASDLINTQPAPDNPADCSVQFKLGYVGSDIYMLVEVTDDVKDMSHTPVDESWNMDSVEVYFDIQTLGGALPADDAAQATSWDTNGGPVQFRFRYDGGDKEIRLGACLDSQAEYAADNSDAAKSVYEIVFKAPAGLAPLSDFTTFGFAMQVNDADTGTRNHTIGWWGGPEQPWGTYNPERGAPRPSQDADRFSPGSFTNDNDGDGLTNTQESTEGTDWWDADTDNDTLPDGWEVDNNLDPLDDGTTDPNNGASGDPDGDGRDNATEYSAGTDPNVPDEARSVPAAGLGGLVALTGLILARMAARKRR